MARTLSNDGTPGLAGIREIVELASLLRDSGDRVLSASSKLSLSTKLLHDLNETFSLIINETDDLECSFQVCNSSRNEVFRDIKFLHDFVQKTIGLKILQNPNDVKLIVDITKFRHLKYLELQKVPVEVVKGIQGVRAQLECLVCAGGRGVTSIDELLAACGGDAGAGFVWGSLHRLALPYNALTHLDKSLEFAPWLDTIDLSHNLITTASELEYLPNLRNVNLGFNNLECVPLFNKATYHTLQKLILKNNYIDNINGLQGLECLVELDISFNCLTDHTMLWPLEAMSMLMWVCLEGNPLYYHPRHRLHTIKHLHPSLSDSKMVLDEQVLNKSERLFVSENRMFALRSSIRRPRHRPRMTASTESTASTSRDDLERSTAWMTPVLPVASTSRDLERSFNALESSIDIVVVGGASSKKRKNVREAVIADEDSEKEIPKPKPASLASSFLESSLDHLETKRQILALRAKYGENNWLSSQSAAMVQSIMGLEEQQQQQSQLNQGEALYSSTFGSSDPQTMRAEANAVGVSPIPTGPGGPVRYVDDAAVGRATGVDSDERTATTNQQRRIEGECESTDEGIVVETETENETDENTVVKAEAPELPDTLEASYDPEEEKGDLYLVQKKKGQEDPDEIFLIITPEDIKERDSITGKIKYRWETSTVLSCVLGRGTPATVDITFDTTRKDREARTYIAELEDAKKIVQTLNEMIKTQPMVLKVFKCMKCSTHFSQDGDHIIVASQLGPPKCPTCKSTLVIQTDELPTPEPERLQRIFERPLIATEQQQQPPDLPHSSSQSSIGVSAEPAGAPPTSAEAAPSPSRSATSLQEEESRESTPGSTAGARSNGAASGHTTGRRYESDIEILSNPSQSSIEVLDEGSKSATPHRKRSSEERRATVAVAPSLLTIPDATAGLAMVGLTESSSSGSLTDSVCTAYENKQAAAKAADKTDRLTTGRSDAETLKAGETGGGGEGPTTTEASGAFAPVTNLTSMLGELLQSMKIGPSRPDTLTRPDESSEFIGSSIQYSYTDFSSVDHRIKLHIILNVFEHENEDLALLLRADILTQSSAEVFPGCLVMSTAKVYILKINGPEGEDPQRWLHKEASWTIDRLRSFAPLPFKQGVLVELQQPAKPGGEPPVNSVVMCILQDFQRTSNFLFYLTDSPLPACCEVEFAVPQYCNACVKTILKSSRYHRDEDSTRLLALFSSAQLRSPNTETQRLKVAGLIVTSSTLIVVQDRIHWLLPGSNKMPAIVAEQGMSNLIEVDFNDTSLVLSFLDEVAGTDSTWSLDFVSPSAAEAVIASIRPPWEELFSVPLQVNGIGAAQQQQQQQQLVT